MEVTNVPDNYLIDPGDLMQNEAFDLRSCIIALQRFLLSTTPPASEQMWFQIPYLRNRPIGQWVETRVGQEAPWYTFNDGKSGRSSSTLPADVRPEDLYIVSVPSLKSTALRDYFDSLVAQFDDNDAGDRQWKERLRKWAKFPRPMYAPDHRERTFKSDLNLLGQLLGSGNVTAEVLDNFIPEVIKSYTDFQVHSVLAGDLCLVAKVLGSAFPYRYTFEIAGGMASLTNCDTLETFLIGLLDHSPVPSEMYKLIANACEYMQSKGEELQDSAMQAEHVGEFYGRIFASMVWLRAAIRGFNFMVGTEGASDKVRVAISVCDERLVVATVSMRIQFADSMDYRELLGHRLVIKKRRAEAGEEAAELLADQYIETEMLYPPFAKACLLGQTDWFPKRKSAA
jgi:hypothetical protein